MTDGAPGAPSPFRCAIAARVRGDPLAGTAAPATRWLLLEHPGPWRVDAVAGLPLSPAVRHAVLAAAEHAHARILLIRRPGRDRFGVERRWFVVDQDGGAAEGPWRDEDDLLTAAAALSSPLPARPDGAPVILVCTHGIHDVCCAIWGRPVAEVLAARWPERVWECSHVGGDRFAPNIVVLPDGFYYGMLGTDEAVELIERHLAGDVDAAHLRGITRFAPPVQAAIVEAYRRFAPLPPGAVHAVAGLAHAGLTHVDITVDARGLVVHAVVQAVRRPATQLTCRAARDTSATEYDIVSFDVSAPPLFPSPSA